MAAPAIPAPARASSWLDILAGVVWESKRIVAAHTRHFLALSVLFILPLSFLLVAAPSLIASSLIPPDPTRPPHETLLRRIAGGTLAAPLACTVAAALLALSAAAAVTRSVRDAFLGRPVKLVAALCSLPSSVWRLLLTSLSVVVELVTYLVAMISIFLICFYVLPFLGFHQDNLDPSVFTGAFGEMVLGVVYMLVKWSLAGVVAVAESNWGWDPLRRSVHLVKGMRSVVLSLMLFFSSTTGFFLWYADRGLVADVEDWRGAGPVIVRVFFASAVIVLLLLYSLVSMTVLYIYCKVLHGELAIEFAGEYVSLPFDDRKVGEVRSPTIHDLFSMLWP